MDLTLLHQNIRAGIDPDHDEKKIQEKQTKFTKRSDPPEPPKQFPYLRNKKSDIVIEKRKLTPIKPGKEEYFVDKARAAAMTYGQDDIKQIGKSNELTSQISVSDETDIAFNLMFGMREIRNRNLENGVFFLSKVDFKISCIRVFKKLFKFKNSRIKMEF